MSSFLGLVLGIPGLGGGASWQSVSVPDDFTWTPPLTIQRNGSQFRVDPEFDLRAYANVAVTKTYYVATTGNDSNSGLDEANALRKVKTALNKADADRVMIKAGTYDYGNGWELTSPNRNMEIIGYGGDVILSTQYSALTWSAVDNHYEASHTVGFGVVVDFSSPDADGDGIPLIRRTSIALVDANPGSWWYDSVADVLYVRTLDSREPDADIRCYIADTTASQNDSVTYYIENIHFHGGESSFLGNIANVGAKAYFKDCHFKYTSNYSAKDGLLISGMGEVICQNCIAARTGGDGFKVQVNAGIVANLILINCIGRWNGIVTATNANGYSRHGPGSTIAINCEFHHNYGPNVADITNGTLTWLLGVNCHDPAALGINYAIDNDMIMWLDTCISAGASTSDLRAINAASKFRYRNMTPVAPVLDGAGTAVTY